jgi:hypothetical protein
MLAALALLLAQASIPDLVRDLGRDSIEVREAAVDALAALGPAALDPLRRAGGDAADVEVRARLGEAVARIEASERIRTFDGGPAVRGLSARLAASWDFDAGRAVVVLEIMNVGAASRDVLPVTGWDYAVPGWSVSSGRSRAKVKADGYPRSDRSGGGMAWVSSCGGHARRIEPTMRLEPGDVARFETTLERCDRDPRGGLQPGRRTLKAIYYAEQKNLVPGAGADLETPEITLEVPE